MSNALIVTNPFTGKTLDTLALDNAAFVEQALDQADRVFRDKSNWLPLHQRVSILESLAKLVRQQKDALALQVSQECGKPLNDAQLEVERAIDGIHLAVETIRNEAGTVVPMGGTSVSTHRIAFTQMEPVGPVVAVSAFNHPFNLIVHQVIPAVATGCPVIVKPALETPLSCRSLVALLHQAGLPKLWCQMVLPESTSLAEALVTDARVGFFSFIGSSRIGWMLRAKLAPGTRCALEHGGVAPLIIAEDGDIEQAAAAVTKGGFYHAGQVCVSVQRVYVHNSVIEVFCQRLVAKTSALNTGDPSNADTDVGPLIRPNEIQRIHSWVTEAASSGQVLCGGKELPNNCYSPTIILNPSNDTKLSQQEVFGPVVCVYGYDDLTSAIEIANAIPVAFQASIFTQKLETALSVYRGINASAVMLNDHTAFRIDAMPFAGLKQSGLGVGGIPHTIADMQTEKMMVIHSPTL